MSHPAEHDDSVERNDSAGTKKSPDPSDVRARNLRWAAYWLMIALAIGNMAGRILAVNSVNLTKVEESRINRAIQRQRQALIDNGFEGEVLAEKLGRYAAEKRESLRLQRPFLSSNDRSRWCTIRALVDHGTYAITKIVTVEDQYDRWQTIDMVKHEQNGEANLYSTKPTLMPTILAGEYWLIQKCTGWTLRDQTYQVVRTMLLTINLPCMATMFILVAVLVERFGKTDWGRLLIMATATFATFLSTFAVVLNNHLIAAASATVALYAAMMIWYDGRRAWWWFAITGFFAAFAAANELPAVAFLGLLGLGLLCAAPRPTLLYGLPAVLVVAAGWFGTNYVAHRTFKPAYAFREPGKDWQTGNWYNYDYQVGNRTKHSYWKRDAASMQSRSAVDRGEPSLATYVTHCLVGHHGIFSLTPIWLLSLAGVIAMIFGRGPPSLRSAGMLIAIVSFVCLAFYLSRGTENRNYGGMTSGLRWMFWFAPMWLVAMIPAADWSAGSRTRRIFSGVLLCFSALSVSYPTWNPWTHPWLTHWLVHLQWIEL